jgi:zinc D-Ala-D-Ala carboxypeptidase
MFQPKRQSHSNPVNRLLTGIISVSLVLLIGASVGVASSSAFASSATPTPDVTIQPIPSPTPSLCGDCFNPNQYSLTDPTSIWVVVNKQRPLNPINYAPAKFGSVNLALPAASAFLKMKHEMYKTGFGILILNSGYRSYQTQVGVHTKDVAKLGLKAGEILAARPGYSEHQTGLAADMSVQGEGCPIKVCFAKTTGGKWLASNSWRFGFILRYPDGQTATTGYQFEPWHFRYVGVTLATEMKIKKISVLENFWKLPAAPNY